MDIYNYNYEIPLKSLPFNLKGYRKEFGLLNNVVYKCPGVYFTHMCSIPGSCPSHDLYVVMEHAPISQEARSYGQKLPGLPGILLYQVEEKDFYHKIIEYEILKFYVKQGIPTSELDTLHSLALHGAELCPEYFGEYPAPTVTPWGYTTRYKTIRPGIFWIETDQCFTALAISYIMQDDLSEEVLDMAYITEFDKERGIDESMGCLFFNEDQMCLAIFELIKASPSAKWDKINIPALMNKIWKDFPEYATGYNLSEQSGQHDILGKILTCFDSSYKPESSSKNIISMTPEAGLDFFRF